MSTEDFTHQLSIKILGSDPKFFDADMLNIRGSNALDFKAALDAYLDRPGANLPESIANVIGLVKPLARVSGAVAAPPAQRSSASSGSRSAGNGASQAAPDTAAPAESQGDPKRPAKLPASVEDWFRKEQWTCNHFDSHGPRQYVEKNGWKALFCPLPQDADKSEKCSPEFGKDPAKAKK